MRSRKTIVFIFLTSAFLVLFSMGAWAEQSGGWLYDLSDIGLTITGYTGSETELEIPYELDGYMVSSIGSRAFADNHFLRSVTIPKGVSSIQAEAFYGCSALSRIEFLAKNCSVPDLWIYDDQKGAGVFSGAGSASPDGLTVIFGEEVARIPDHLFDTASTDVYGLDGYPYAYVTDIEISGSVREIGAYAFRNCQELNSVTLGSSTEKIYDYAFWNCTGMKSLVMSSALQFAEQHAFENCTALEEIVWGDGMDYIGASAFAGCSSLKELEIPNPLNTLRERAFADCTGLTSLVLPESLTNLGGEAFRGCVKLNTILINSKAFEVPEIWIYDDQKGAGVFSGAGAASPVGLTVFFGPQVSKVPAFLFDTASTSEYGHDGYPFAYLTEAVISDSVHEIGSFAFRGCQNLEKVFLNESAIDFGEGVFDGCISPLFELVHGLDQAPVYVPSERKMVDGNVVPSVTEQQADEESGETPETWTCSNGHEGNTGNFCPECGEPRPKSCASCGYEFPGGEAPNFCPNCGAPQN